nr:uncharacterized protein LOC107373993 [Nothobranchius furzeri]
MSCPSSANVHAFVVKCGKVNFWSWRSQSHSACGRRQRRLHRRWSRFSTGTEQWDCGADNTEERDEGANTDRRRRKYIEQRDVEAGRGGASPNAEEPVQTLANSAPTQSCGSKHFNSGPGCLEATDPEEEQTRGLSVGILTVLEDNWTSPVVNVMNLAVVVEETIILQDLPDLPTAFGFVFGLIYVLNLQYPKDLRYTFETVQKIFMGLGTDLSARVRSLKNRLFL